MLTKDSVNETDIEKTLFDRIYSFHDFKLFLYESYIRFQTFEIRLLPDWSFLHIAITTYYFFSNVWQGQDDGVGIEIDKRFVFLHKYYTY